MWSWYCKVHETIVCFTGDRGIVFVGGGNNSAYNNVVYNSSAYGGIEAIWSNNNTMYNNLAYSNRWGIATNHGSYNLIYNNTVYSNEEGIHIDWPSTGNNVCNNDISSNTYFGINVMNQANENIISGNEISGNFFGVLLWNSSNNIVTGNSITDNWDLGIRLDSSSNNKFYHNNLVDNMEQVWSTNSTNTWDDDYPSGGNYWSDHNPPDVYSGPNQNETGSDGIGDNPYVIDVNNKDRYPLIYPYGYVPSPDLNNDGIVTISDVIICALAFGSKPGNPNWNPIIDLNQDGIINIIDLVIIGVHFGETL